MQNIKEEERRKHKAQLDFLQAQINPHFLHNTLFSIKCLVSLGKVEAAEEMIGAFMDLLRMTLDNKDEFITLNEEIAAIKKYIHLQRYRYSNKFEAVFNCENSLLNCKIPKLILQPIIENAIFHGIEPKRGNGRITISATEEDECLIINVEDDGVGMSPETIEKIKKGESETSRRTFNMVGIANIEQRIILNYGSQYGINIKSTIGKGTCVTLKLPLVE